MEIIKSTITSAIWRNFYNRLKSQVTSVNISISPGSQTIQTYASSFSDVDFSSKSNFPILLINNPSISQEQFTFRKTQVNATIDIEIYTTNSQAADKFLDAINNAIETYKGDFADLGIHMLELDSTDSDFVEHGNIRVHMRRARYKLNYKFLRTKAY